MEVKKYSIFLRILHWLIALLIIGLLAVGLYMEDMEKSANIVLFGQSFGKYDLYGLHKSFGMLVLIFICVRVLVRLGTKVPEYPEGFPKWNIRLAHYGHCALYGLMIVVPVAGYLMSTFGGHQVKMFGIDIVALFEVNKEYGGVAHTVHWVMAYAMLVVILVHVGAVVKHCVSGAAHILRRML